MKFEKIFEESGLYKTESLQKGVCFEVTKTGNLLVRIYKNANDVLPIVESAHVHKNDFKKEYTKVNNIHQLFKN